MEGYRLAARNFHLPYLRLVSAARAESARGDASESGAARWTASRAPPKGGEFEVTEREASAALRGVCAARDPVRLVRTDAMVRALASDPRRLIGTRRSSKPRP